MLYIKETDEILIKKNDIVRIGLDYYKFIGNVKKIHQVPATNCLFALDGLLYIRKIDLNRLRVIKNLKEPVVKSTDDSTELDLKINPGEDDTLIIVKELLKGFTKSSFKKLFDNDSEMNNMRRAIEKSPNGQLSLKRFKYILNKLGLRYKIVVFEEDIPPAFDKKEFAAKIDNINNERFDVPLNNEEDSDDED